MSLLLINYLQKVKKIGELHEIDQSVFISITVIHELIEHRVTNDHVKLLANILQILLIDFPLTLLQHETKKTGNIHNEYLHNA